MKVYSWNLSREKLDAMPEEERTLFLALGHFANQAAILSKWALWTEPGGKTTVERCGTSAQAILCFSLAAAKLNEGWELIQKQYYASKLSKEYAALLPRDAREALEKLGRYFGQDNVLNTCRNEYAFHYDSSKMKEHYPKLPKGESTEIFLTEPVGLSLYHVCEMAAAHAMLTTIGKGDAGKGMESLVTDLLRVSGLFQMFVSGFMTVFLKRLGPPEPKMENFEGLPKLHEFRIPFLAETG